MVIITDTNEQATNPDVVKRLKKTFPKLIVSSLTCGDVNVIMEDGRRIAVERKMPQDFLGSIGDGRIFKQVQQMAECSAYYAIILTGGFEFDDDDMVIVTGRRSEPTNWHGKSVRAAMAAIQWSACPIIQTSEYNYPLAIQELIDFCSKPSARMQMPQSHRIVTFPPVDQRVEILSAFPGIGVKRADALLKFVGNGEDYGTLSDAFQFASAMNHLNDDSKPEGWGKVTVANFRASMGLFDNEHFAVMVDGEAKDANA